MTDSRIRFEDRDESYQNEPSPREQAQYLKQWLFTRWGDFSPAFETALCNAIAALEATDP